MTSTDGHVDELLSGYIDGELTQQDSQRVALHCETCAECQAELAALSALRERVAAAPLAPPQYPPHPQSQIVRQHRRRLCQYRPAYPELPWTEFQGKMRRSDG